MVWKEVKQANSPRPYYFDTESRKTSWVKPVELYNEKELAVYKQGWRVLTTQDGKVYYANTEQKKSSWEFPQIDEPLSERKEPSKPVEKETGSKPVLSSDEKTKPHTEKINEHLKAAEKTATVQKTLQNVVSEPQAVEKNEPKKEIHPQRAVDNVLDGSKLKSKYMSSLITKIPENASFKLSDLTKDNFEQNFIQMLKDNNVDSTWSFQKVVDELSVKDPRYWCPNTNGSSTSNENKGFFSENYQNPLVKNQLFQKYLDNRSEQELIKERDNLQNFQQMFLELLKKHKIAGDIKYYSKWATVKRKILLNEPLYRNSVAIDESVKKTIFKEFVYELRIEHESGLQTIKEKAFGELDAYFETILHDHSASGSSEELQLADWAAIKEAYLFGNKQFDSNKNFKSLNELDVFQRYLQKLEPRVEALEQQKKILEEKIYTRERIIRDQYMAFLKSQRIYSTSQWSDISDNLKQTGQFLALLRVNYQSPFDYFAFYVDELTIEMQSKATSLQQIIASENLTIGKVLDLSKQNGKNLDVRSLYFHYLQQNKLLPNSVFRGLDKTESDIVVGIVLEDNKRLVAQKLHKLLDTLSYQERKLPSQQEFLGKVGEFDRYVFDDKDEKLIEIYNTHVQQQQQQKMARPGIPRPTVAPSVLPKSSSLGSTLHAPPGHRAVRKRHVEELDY
ncbi:hypothetical protein ACO0QE_004786 [Hanseniaspora vineae]